MHASCVTILNNQIQSVSKPVWPVWQYSLISSQPSVCSFSRHHPYGWAFSCLQFHTQLIYHRKIHACIIYLYLYPSHIHLHDLHLIKPVLPSNLITSRQMNSWINWSIDLWSEIYLLCKVYINITSEVILIENAPYVKYKRNYTTM